MACSMNHESRRWNQVDSVPLACKLSVNQITRVRGEKSALVAACWSLLVKVSTTVCCRHCKERRIFETFCSFVVSSWRLSRQPAGLRLSSGLALAQEWQSSGNTLLCSSCNFYCSYNTHVSHMYCILLTFASP